MESPIFRARFENIHCKEKLPRFVVEDGIKPPIFGSYSYNPLTKTFEVKAHVSEVTPSDLIHIQIYNKTATQAMSTLQYTEHNRFELRSGPRQRPTIEQVKPVKKVSWWATFNNTIGKSLATSHSTS
ncbi:unnamed protein product [Leptidea sinapis]|uniref:Uncharacterized protein n=1 Tax=Leptidea sinapis TaxID=189913 RepID=A0A5E4QSX4_9NEOP|nr:unnamed protein product [Leptidea sinapis]